MACAVSHEDDGCAFFSQDIQGIRACNVDCFINCSLSDSFLVSVDVISVFADFAQQRLSNLDGINLICELIHITHQLIILCAVHQVCRLDDQVLNAIVNCSLQSLLGIVDLLTVTCVDVVDDDLSCECSSDTPVRIRFSQSSLNTTDICGSAVIEGCTEGYHQQLILADVITVERIILGSIACVQSEVIRIVQFFLLLIAQCIISSLGSFAQCRRVICPLLDLDGLDRFIACCDQIHISCFFNSRFVCSFLLGAAAAGEHDHHAECHDQGEPDHEKFPEILHK